MFKPVCHANYSANAMRSVRFFGVSCRVLQDFPTFDHSLLNPLSNKSSQKSNQLSQSLNHDYVQKTRSNGQNSARKFAEFAHNPRDDALSSRLTGVAAGRTVDVFNNDTASAFRQLNSIMFANRIPQDSRNQRFYMKPGKVAELKRSQKHRRDFMKGFKRLIEIVKDAKRKGY
ncbi:hypothetical protein HG536_0B04410 [Torulaspora globosa]|uniref:Ribosomal protein S21 n=1 Tax=Torulaspora globosa TaxID=48254 RepID=A0A7G3ZDJ1_9SACH|nr:uncharacterized protein HG536_0B04410 [Torulaspora globosa]QLL31577.1 hypothetical protein HG536_0B04410 [Torulaspora globosa]